MGYSEDKDSVREELGIALSSLEKIREIGFSNQREDFQFQLELKLVRRVLQAELLLRETLAELRR